MKKELFEMPTRLAGWLDIAINNYYATSDTHLQMNVG